MRVGAINNYGVIDPNSRVGQYLWHTLDAHLVMYEFKDAYSHNHSQITPSIVNNLFEN